MKVQQKIWQRSLIWGLLPLTLVIVTWRSLAWSWANSPTQLTNDL